MKYNHIISLGSDCLPRVAATRHSLKKTKKDGELSLPFDLSVTSFDNMLQLISNDFSQFTNPDQYCMEKIGDVEVISHKIYKGTYFNHESPFMSGAINFCENNWSLLKARYDVRVANFRKYVADNDILFILHVKEDNDIQLLCSAIKGRYPELRFEILVIHLYECINVINYDQPHVYYLKYFIRETWNQNDNVLDFVIKLTGEFIKYNTARDNIFPI